MSMLLRFHVVLIVCGVLFCGGFALYELFLHSDAGTTKNYLAAGVATLAAIVLAVYLRLFLRHVARG
ncbi:MAG TPA: hypothetical protein VFD71_13975 [Planctomycetota bacterium]|jgi:hypothetical protein|nr:hypothetical protein [Planctomycetota bacterium]